MTSRQTAWQHLLDYTRQMLEAAEAGEWESLAEMARERQKKFEAFFAEPVPEELAEEVASGIHRIGDIDAAITGLAQGAEREFAAEHEVFKKRRQASSAYSDPANRNG